MNISKWKTCATYPIISLLTSQIWKFWVPMTYKHVVSIAWSIVQFASGGKSTDESNLKRGTAYENFTIYYTIKILYKGLKKQLYIITNDVNYYCCIVGWVHRLYICCLCTDPDCSSFSQWKTLDSCFWFRIYFVKAPFMSYIYSGETNKEEWVHCAHAP